MPTAEPTRPPAASRRGPGAAPRALRALAAVLGVAAAAALALAAAAWFLREPLAGRLAETALARAGLGGADVTATRVAADRAAFAVAVADGPAATVSVTYDLGTLWSTRRADTVRVADARLRVSVDEAGARIEGLEGLSLPEGGGGGARPFARLVIERAAVTLVSPGGVAAGTAAGTLGPEGFDGSLRLEGDGGAAGAMLSDATVRASGRLDADGRLSVEAALSGALDAMGRRAEGVVLTASFAATGWREGLAGAVGEGAVTLASARTAGLRVSGRAEASVSDGVLRAVIAEADLVREDGAFARIDAGTAVEARLSDGALSASGGLAFDLPQAVGRARLSAARAPGGPARVSLDAAFDAEVAGMDLRGAAFDGTLEAEDGVVSFGGEAEGRLARWTIGPLTIEDVPLRGPLRGRYALAGGDVRVAAPGCLAAPRAAAAVAQTTVAMTDVRLCADGALFERSGAAFSARGTVRAGRVRTTVADTPLTGRDAALRFEAEGREGGGSAARGGLTLGALDLPGGFVAEGTAATARTAPDGLAFTLERTRLHQPGPAPAVAPAILTGTGVAGGASRFDGALSTPGGDALAEVRLRQDEGGGEAVLRAPGLRFAPGGLQPAQLLPSLRGLISEAVGGVSGEASARWPGPEAAGGTAAGVETGARLVLDELSFRGPGLTVQRTAGLTGTVNLASLRPLRSAGVQDVSVRLVDLGAIQLPDGQALLSLPGDGSLEIVSAAFPWMGGRLSVADATLRRGGEADAVLRVDGVQLAEILDFVDVDGLSGEGVLDGALPMAASQFAIRVEDGRFRSRGPGVVRYTGKVADAAKQAADAKLAFSVLEEFRFDELAGTVAGPLDGTLAFGLRFDGTSRVAFDTPYAKDRVVSPFIYNITLEAALLDLLDQARLSTDSCRQLAEAGAADLALWCLGEGGR